MKLNARGIVLKVNPYGESNRVITILTEELGIIRAFVHGASSVKSKNNTSTSLLSYANFTLSSKKDAYTVDEASAIEIFYELRRDIERSSLAQYFCEIFAFFAPAEAEAKEYLRLILNALALLTKGEKELSLIKAVTELYLMKLSGYMPEISGCAECGTVEGEFFFDVENGVIICDNCHIGSGKKISQSVMSAMRFILFSEFNRIFSFTLGNDALNELNSFSEEFLLSTAERGFKTLDFFNTIKSYS